MANMSEDALFKALLKNKPAPKPPAVQAAQSAPIREVSRPAPVPQPVEKHQVHEQPPVEIKAIPAVKPIDLDPVVDSIIQLNSSVNMVAGTMKNIITPILILILVVLIGILIRS